MELKPCPFCGYPAVFESFRERKGYAATIYCCGCLAEITTITYDTEKEAEVRALRAWNRRANKDDKVLRNKRRDDCPLFPVPEPHGRLIEEADAIETAWMILRGLGYFKEENPQLEQTVREVFATAPAVWVEEHG